MAVIGKQTVTLSPDGQVTLPPEIRAAAQFRAGEQILLEFTDQGILLRAIDPDQTWFWVPEWQEGEREVDEAIARGERGPIYHDTEEFLAALDHIPLPPADK